MSKYTCYFQTIRVLTLIFYLKPTKIIKSFHCFTPCLIYINIALTLTNNKYLSNVKKLSRQDKQGLSKVEYFDFSGRII